MHLLGKYLAAVIVVAPLSQKAEGSRVHSILLTCCPAAWLPQIPKTAAGGKSKKKGKGQKVDMTLLGFGTGTNYSCLEQPE